MTIFIHRDFCFNERFVRLTENKGLNDLWSSVKVLWVKFYITKHAHKRFLILICYFYRSTAQANNVGAEVESWNVYMEYWLLLTANEVLC